MVRLGTVKKYAEIPYQRPPAKTLPDPGQKRSKNGKLNIGSDRLEKRGEIRLRY